MPNDLRRSAHPEEVAHAAADYILEELTSVLKSQPRASVAVSGGSSPRAMFSKMASSGFDWSNVHFFWVDERCVEPTDDQSNYKLLRETLLVPAHVPEVNIHRVHGELLPEEAAIHYLNDIKAFFSLKEGELPVFDIVHRGMGPDAHTASLFPGEPLIDNRQGIAADVYVEKLKSHRVTLLPGVLLKAKKTVLQVVGEDKAEALSNVLQGPEDPKQYPCQLAARDSATAVWFVDQAAAARL